MFRRAPAKLNLALSVGSALPPGDPAAGMHPICSWMHCIDLFDDVHIKPRTGASRGASRRPIRESLIEVEWAADAPVQTEIDWPLEQDLAVRALRLLEAHAGEPLPVHMQISKRIPLGGGLGGGSSDAAAVLMAVNQLFALGLSVPELAQLSRSIGSDVAFFLDEADPPRPAVVSGLGDAVERTAPVSPATAEVVLILPSFGCPTGLVYQAFDTGGGSQLQSDRIRSLACSPLDPPSLFNDLTHPAHSVQPPLADLHHRLSKALSAPVHLTGSGSTLFVLTQDPVHIQQRVSQLAPAAAICRTRLI